MNILFLILGIATASTSYELVKIPIGMAAKHITCEQAFTKHTISVENPNYKVISIFSFLSLAVLAGLGIDIQGFLYLNAFGHGGCQGFL